VHHYFDDKAELFAESLHSPLRPDRVLRDVLAGSPDEIGERLVRVLVMTIDEPKARKRIIAILHAALGQEFAATMLRQFLAKEVLGRLAVAVGGADAPERASLAASQIVGLIVARYGVKVEPLASLPVDEVVARVGPVVQWYLTGATLDGGTL
jgi:hypothetical protein